MAKGKINFGIRDMLPGKVDPKDVKVRISIMLDSDVLTHYKKRAEKTGGAYQTMMNLMLRQGMTHDNEIEKRLSKVEKTVGEIMLGRKKAR